MITATVQPDPQAIAEHLAALQACAAGTSGLLVLAAFGEDPATGTALPPLIAHFAIGDWQTMTDCAMEWSAQAHRNVYTPLAVMRPDLVTGKKGEERDIVKVLGLVADFDDPDAPQWATRSPIQPTAILETSPRRFQCLYLFDRPLDVVPAKELARRLQAHTGCDFGTKDLSHVWRIGGTLNWPNQKKAKAGRSVEPCLVVEVPGGSNAVIDATAIDQSMPIITTRAAAPPPNRPSVNSHPTEDGSRLSDDALLTRASTARDGWKFARLFSGETAAYGDDESRADLALCTLLAWWTNHDQVQMDRLFRRSGLMRTKWDREDYRARTLAKAVQGVAGGYQVGVDDRPPIPPSPHEQADEAPPDEGRPQEDASSLNEAPNSTPISSGRDHGLTKELADMILSTDHFAQDAGGQLFVYHEGVYRPQGETRITQRVKAILLNNGETKRWSSHRAREVVEFIRVDAPRLWDRPPVDLLNCRNGLLDIPSLTLRSHTPAHLSLVQLPVTYDSTATCPLWDSFIAQVLPDDCRGYPYELVAGSMCGDVSDQTAALAVGIGQTGKSTLLDAVSACLGRENVTNLALHRLENDKFAVVRLLGKLANICADLPSEHLTSTSTFKALTGGDSLTAERKFQSSFELRPFCRLIFSANHYPQSKDSSSAFFRRWLVIPFDTVIEPHQRIPKFAAQLADPSELSGVLNRALLVLPDMRRRGGFSQCETTQAAMQEFREMTDPLAAWVDRFTVLAVDKLVTKKDLLIAYNGQAETSGRPPMTPKSFYAGVKRLRPTITEAQRTVCGEVKHVFLGLGLRATSAISTTSVSAPEGLFAEEVVDDH